MKIKDGTTKPFEAGDNVVYIPRDLLTGPKINMVIEKNLGYVTSKNNDLVFVRYIGTNSSQATNPNDLYFVTSRPDLIEKIENWKNG